MIQQHLNFMYTLSTYVADYARPLQWLLVTNMEHHGISFPRKLFVKLSWLSDMTFVVDWALMHVIKYLSILSR